MKLRSDVDVEAETPFFEHISTPWTIEKSTYPDASTPLVQVTEDFPLPRWTWARRDKRGRRFPQTIAHRGYKAIYPENTLQAFKGAVAVGTHAIETDIHLSKDNVVVISHDSTLQRCFGEKRKIIDCDWEYLSRLRTLKPPHEPMPRLKDLLDYVAQPGMEHLWLLLDIKLDNDADDVMRLIAKTIASVEPGQRAWKDRVVLGIWAARFLPLCTKYLPGFPITHIGFSTSYARNFFKVPNVSFNILQKVLLGPIGARFIRDVKAAGRQLFVWTINETNLMKWSIQKEVDGVITDDPKKFNRVCDEWDDDEPPARLTWFQWLYTFWLYMVVAFFHILFRYKFPETVDQFIGGRKPIQRSYT